MMYFTIIKTKDLEAEYPAARGLFFPYEMLVYKNGKQYQFSIETRDINGRQDCKIGSFGDNVWMRPAAALKDDFNGYKSIGVLSTAVQNCLISHGYHIQGWINKKD